MVGFLLSLDDYLGIENIFPFLLDFALFSALFWLFSEVFVFLASFRFLWCNRFHRLRSFLNKIDKPSFAFFLFFHLR